MNYIIAILRACSQVPRFLYEPCEEGNNIPTLQLEEKTAQEVTCFKKRKMAIC